MVLGKDETLARVHAVCGTALAISIAPNSVITRPERDRPPRRLAPNRTGFKGNLE